ncbi:hypothetical protein F01_420914 [Burkholderia cenocepacia]|nr:hypothetical protein F01_420914 [Burkholderia cenocepacia]
MRICAPARSGVVRGDAELDKRDGMVANALEGNGLSGRRHRYLHDCCKKLYADNSIACEDSVRRVGTCRAGAGLGPARWFAADEMIRKNVPNRF